MVDRKEALKFLTKLLALLEGKWISVFLESKSAEHPQKTGTASSLEKIQTDLIIAVGGDGTILMRTRGESF